MARTRDFAKIIRSKLKQDRDLGTAVESESFNADVAMQVYQLRTEAGVTQQQLADRINTKQSVISRIEDADYDGHSLALLKRIAEALGKKLRVEFYSCPAPSAVQWKEVSEYPTEWDSVQEWDVSVTKSETVLS